MSEYIVRETGYPGTVKQEVVGEIVRCKDCKWKHGSECTRFADVRPNGDDFCSRGVRREAEGSRNDGKRM